MTFLIPGSSGGDGLDVVAGDVSAMELGSGERLFDGVESLGLEPVEAHSPLATHIRYRRAG
jgi:hypothetical protein